ncbi:MAG: peptidylprolyl isomerase [Candidatus Omnitrophica bacterium]|nr:peptidylprolyl isomerase [Candidatus Omnitrophota bacterium]MCM8816131.1 peptidylprolyl isomerase [Candidatus Omnitrophota bacterium]
MNKILIFLICLGFTYGFAAEKKQDPVVLKIGNQSFTLKEFEKNLNQMRVRYVNLNPDMKKRLFDQFVKEKLFFTAAQDSGIKLTEEQSENIERLKTMYVITNYISKMLQENPVTETEIKYEYEKNPQQYQTPERRKLRHILVQTEEKAKEILEQLKNGASFEELASQHNTDATKQRGGDLGWGQRGIYVKEFENVAFSLKKDEISDIVKTQFGYHIIRVDEISPAQQRSLNEVSQEIKRKLEQNKIATFEEQLKKKYKVQVDYSPIEDIKTK